MRGVRFWASVMAFVLTVASLLPLPTVNAAELSLTENEAIETLQQYGIVRGDGDGNLNLDQPLTRAEAATIFVRSMKAESLAELLADVVPFPDARGHWAAGEIAMAERLGLMKGDGNGNFRPDDKITYAEVLTVLLRMVKQEPGGPWSSSAILSEAGDLGILPTGVNGNDTAVRTKVFWSLAAAITTIPVDGQPSHLRRYLDQEPPVIKMDMVSGVTSDASFTISGTTVEASRVLIDGKPAVLDLETGRFSVKVSPDVGLNTFVVTAFDAAGNEATETISIERRSTISRLTITGPRTLYANTSTKLTVEAKDRSGNLLPLENVEVEITGVDATFNTSTTTLVTAATAGRGTLTLRAGSARATYRFEVVAPSTRAELLVIEPINKDYPLALNKEETVTVKVVDSSGRVVTDDYGRVITLSSTGLTPLTITPVTPITDRGVATFKVIGQAIGATTLTATTPGLEQASRPIEILTARRVMLVPSAKSLTPDGTSSATIKAQLQDETGRRVSNDTGTDIQIMLTATGTDSLLANQILIIPKGRSDSGSTTATLTSGIAPGTVTVQGRFLSSHSYAIQTLQVPVTDPLAGVKMELTAIPSTVAPGSETTIMLRVVDGNNRVVTSGSYAFQLKVTTSNNDPQYQGLPDGVTVSFPNSPYYPVDDGRPATDLLNDPYSVVGRTHKGEATVTLRYSRSAVVEVQPVLLPATYEAYHPSLGVGPATASTNLLALPLDIYFQGSAARIELTVDSAVGKDLKGGALGGAGTMTLRARVVDSYGSPVPGFNNVITVTRLGGGDEVSNIVGFREKRAVNGVVEFTVQAIDRAGVDQYRVSTNGLTSQPVTLSVRKTKAPQPTVTAIRGVREGGLSPVAGFVGPDAEYMDIQLLPVVDPKEDQYWVLAKVYRQGEGYPFFTQPIDLRNGQPIIHIPKKVLRDGRHRYAVVIANGFGDTTASLTLDQVTEAVVASYNDSIRLTSAFFNADSGRLYLTASGLSPNGTIDKGKLSLVKGSSILSMGSDEVSVVTPINYSQVILDLSSLAVPLDPDTFHGTVSLQAQAGWYVGPGDSVVARDFTVPVTPMAVITDGALDVAGKRLYLNGEGFSQGSLQLNLVQVRTGDTDGVTLRPGYDRVLGTSDTQVIIGLSDATYNAIAALNGPSLYVTADHGWIRSTSSSFGRTMAITGTNHRVWLRILATTASYDADTDTLTIQGSHGFNGLTLDPGKLVFKTDAGAGWAPLATASVVATSDTSVTVTLAPEDATVFESTFGGKHVYLNTQNGWLTDPRGWMVLPVPDYSVLFTFRVN